MSRAASHWGRSRYKHDIVPGGRKLSAQMALPFDEPEFVGGYFVQVWGKAVFYIFLFHPSQKDYVFSTLFSTHFRNDKFADVLLFTSHSDGGCGIPAHKIILSSCSHVSILRYAFFKWEHSISLFE